MFNLADYEPVEVRLEKFIKDYPDFRISTELEVVEASRYIVKAYLFKTGQDSIAWATGYAEETVSTRGVNQTSALENCETSAIGRALANAGYAPKGKRPSREEMSKVAPNHPALKVVKQEVFPGTRANITGVRPIVDATATVTVKTRERLADTETESSSSTMTNSGINPVRQSGRYVRANVKIASGTNWNHAQGIDLVASRAGYR